MVIYSHCLALLEAQEHGFCSDSLNNNSTEICWIMGSEVFGG